VLCSFGVFDRDLNLAWLIVMRQEITQPTKSNQVVLPFGRWIAARGSANASAAMPLLRPCHGIGQVYSCAYASTSAAMQ